MFCLSENPLFVHLIMIICRISYCIKIVISLALLLAILIADKLQLNLMASFSKYSNCQAICSLMCCSWFKLRLESWLQNWCS